MRKLLFTAAMLLSATFANAQEITLPSPVKVGGTSTMEAFANRKSDRTFSDKELDSQTLSNLLWATAGVNRPESNHHTNPTASNKQEIRVYAFTKDGASLYDPASHSLKTVANGDFRKMVAGSQAFAATAPLSLVIVMDVSKFGEVNHNSYMMAAVDAGIMCQNINLFCAANGLKTVPRATMDVKGISALLMLNEQQVPIMNNPVGY